MNGLIADFPYDGVVTVNRVILKPGYTVDDLQE
ncbi:MAG: ligand-binding protein SH3, partial [gamma proteobacterium symbiont of Stewartia floridana]